jgi:hypothetical protein
MAELHLRVEDFQDAEHWRWLLQDQAGAFLADHLVALTPPSRVAIEGLIFQEHAKWTASHPPAAGRAEGHD